jgi:hypothetical protein
MFMLVSAAAKAQVSVSVNIGSPPQWGPVGYTDVRYYYLPDVEAYYDIQSSMFIYYGNGIWIHNAYLPVRYRYYDLYTGYKVVMVDYRGDSPYINFKEYKVKYKKGYRGPAQKTIGAKPGKGNSQNNSVKKPSVQKNTQQNKSNDNKSDPKNGSKNSPEKKGGQQNGKGKK